MRSISINVVDKSIVAVSYNNVRGRDVSTELFFFHGFLRPRFQMFHRFFNTFYFINFNRFSQLEFLTTLRISGSKDQMFLKLSFTVWICVGEIRSNEGFLKVERILVKLIFGLLSQRFK